MTPDRHTAIHGVSITIYSCPDCGWKAITPGAFLGNKCVRCLARFMAPEQRKYVALDGLVGIRTQINGELAILHPDDVEFLYSDAGS